MSRITARAIKTLLRTPRPTKCSGCTNRNACRRLALALTPSSDSTAAAVGSAFSARAGRAAPAAAAGQDASRSTSGKSSTTNKRS